MNYRHKVWFRWSISECLSLILWWNAFKRMPSFVALNFSGDSCKMTIGIVVWSIMIELTWIYVGRMVIPFSNPCAIYSVLFIVESLLLPVWCSSHAVRCELYIPRILSLCCCLTNFDAIQFIRGKSKYEIEVKHFFSFHFDLFSK